MEEELKKRIAESTNRICKEYKTLTMLLSPFAGSNLVLQQYLSQVNSVLQYAEAHYQNPSSVDLAICKQRHDPARLLNEVESRFNAQEQGFYQLYPNAQFKAQLRSHFDATRDDFDILENCLSVIS
ncbi:hypothetical protein [Arachidicoccus terrestris]|uniref:hypothetical protein n=1 Tax=Arachidicoccus terrestris TaxID=2875539 RepID=UPI001CC35D09|nr:hypothetical protein [Arachidicoccus terrestris]UAY56713.1 hypothetical protein K9M52_06885 [Arachidicoccus terrestris]